MNEFFEHASFRGQTNTLEGLDKALDVFNSSQHFIEEDWQRLAVLITDGEPTLHPLWAHYGSNPCQPEYAVNNRFDEMRVFLWAGLIGNIRTTFLQCFKPSGSTIKCLNDYKSLGEEISGIVGEAECKHSMPIRL